MLGPSARHGGLCHCGGTHGVIGHAGTHGVQGQVIVFPEATEGPWEKQL